MKNNTNSVFLWGAALAGVGLYFLLNPNTETQSPGQPAPAVLVLRLPSLSQGQLNQ